MKALRTIQLKKICGISTCLCTMELEKAKYCSYFYQHGWNWRGSCSLKYDIRMSKSRWSSSCSVKWNKTRERKCPQKTSSFTLTTDLKLQIRELQGPKHDVGGFLTCWQWVWCGNTVPLTYIEHLYSCLANATSVKRKFKMYVRRSFSENLSYSGRWAQCMHKRGRRFGVRRVIWVLVIFPHRL